MNVKIAIIGATGLVGRKIVSILNERKFPISSLHLLSRSKKEVTIDGKLYKTEISEDFDFNKVDLVFGASSKDSVRKLLGPISDSDAIFIDKSELLRMDKDIPLVVPEVNPHKINSETKVICSPNCVAIAISVILNNLRKKTKIERMFASINESVSGAGTKALNALLNETKESLMSSVIQPQFFEKEIAFNILPQVGEALDDGKSEEEFKITSETHKIMESKFPVNITVVRVPVMVGHSIALHVMCDLEVEDAVKCLKSSDLFSVADEKGKYFTPRQSANTDKILISRVRRANGILSMWVCYDNLRKGAALNAVQIAELLDFKKK
ncbi:aspartate-semialdehyde dehydrogenase [Candidatus Nesciobacter abundans]|uniref:aspartate-semialdehyde dehydrogenase n=1 Tax=Candidatus Nesciobacter abundans TaxID=2601668 RepID=UPI00165342C9|nr:aspartate-semialdehyde dehydrogenase [Candidatus Nesciobacter abundans]